MYNFIMNIYIHFKTRNFNHYYYFLAKHKKLQFDTRRNDEHFESFEGSY